jgi:hypothetical protein
MTASPSVDGARDETGGAPAAAGPFRSDSQRLNAGGVRNVRRRFVVTTRPSTKHDTASTSSLPALTV